MDELIINDNKITLFTCQNIKSLEILKNDKRIVNKKEYIKESFGVIADIFIRGYDWFVKEADNRVKKPMGSEYHIWCSTNAENCMKPIENEVIYILEVPIKKVIFFDSIKWDHVLNLRYVPKDDLDYKKYIDNLKRKGIKSEYDIFDDTNGNLNLIEREKVINSWPRIFDISNTNIDLIQANIWEIREEWVKDIVNYQGEIPKKYFRGYI